MFNILIKAGPAHRNIPEGDPLLVLAQKIAADLPAELLDVGNQAMAAARVPAS